MADGSIPVQNPAVSDSLLDTEELLVGADTVHRERMQLAGSADIEIARILAAAPASTDYGVVVRQVREDTIGAIYLSSAARTVTQTQADQTNRYARGITVVLDVTTAGTGSITLSIQGKDPASGKYVTLLAGAAVTTISTNVYRVYPSIAAVANAAAQDTLWRTFRILVTANNANSMTYSVGYILLP